MAAHEIRIPYSRYADISELPVDEQRLLRAAWDATEFAHAPYSRFRVGCAILLEGGEIVTGNNQENIAYPSGLCAERVALFAVGAKGDIEVRRIRKMAVRARTDRFDMNHPPTSCGACRQVMVEFEKRAQHPIALLTQGKTGDILRFEGVEQCLMPFGFEADL